MEDKKLKEIESAKQLEIFNQECRRSGILPEKMESEKEELSCFDDINVDCDTFKDDEDEALKEEAQEPVLVAEDAKMACNSSESVHLDHTPGRP